MSDSSETPTKPVTHYRVLARKYRPATFEDLVGQDALVRTLTNAFASGRIAQAYMLTGVRGVGKTTTARLIARALNYVSPDGDTGPSIDLSVKAEHCDAILESRHVDVVEMDAASHTGVDNVREINDAVRYKPATARYKVYIIDEVHMLSTAAFNALLKTLEEPPPHVKFIFATTEIRKVPVTVLSRCQRFDLRRLDSSLLIDHFKMIASKESVEAEEEALRMIARAAEGSLRDGLSLLDQAIAFGVDKITAEDVQAMLGLSDRSRIMEMFSALMQGNAAAALDELEAQHAHGADPEAILSDLAAFVHFVTKIKVSEKSADDATFTPAERARGLELAGRLGMPSLARAWQMLLKGIEETARAGEALKAAEMVLIRLAHVADLPPPEELARLLAKGSDTPGTSQTARAASPPDVKNSASSQPATTQPAGNGTVATDAGTTTATARQLQPAPDERSEEADIESPLTAFKTFEDVVNYVASKRDIKLQTLLERHVVPVSVKPGRIEIALQPEAPAGIANDLSRRLEAWTGGRWMVLVSSQAGGQTLAQVKADRRDSLFNHARQQDDVKTVLESFPGAEIVEVRDLSDQTEQADTEDIVSDDDDDNDTGDWPDTNG